MTLVLRNPHSILAALEQRPADVLAIRLPPGGGGEAWAAVADYARRQGLRDLAEMEPERGGRKARRQDGPGRHGGGEARLREKTALDPEQLFENIDPDQPGLWLALDQVQDPQNLGAIFRSAAFFGLRGLLYPRDRSAPLNEAAYDIASGGIEYVPHAEAVNLARALELAKERGLWILGSSEHAAEPASRIPHDRPWLLVVGNEGRGLRPLTERHCDMLCAIPRQGPVGSLNASVAAGILMHALSAG